MKGVFLCSQAAARIMIPQGSGSIINLASISGHAVNIPQKQAVYNASKAGVAMLTKSMALEWIEHGIRVNSISPGYMKTEIPRETTSSEREKAILNSQCVKRFGVPQDLLGVILFLASEESDFMSGQSLSMDGGDILL